MANRRTNSKRTGTEINPVALGVIAVLLVLAVAGIVFLIARGCDGGKTPETTVSQTAESGKVTGDTRQTGETEPEDPSVTEPDPGTETQTDPGSKETKETEKTGETGETEKTDPEPDPDKPVVESTAEQLLSVVGWALTDTTRDGFHYRYLDDKSVQALAKAVLTLASQNDLGIRAETQQTDDPNQVMLPSEELNRILSSMIKGASLKDGQSSGTLVQVGSGWAMTPSYIAVDLPHTAVIGTEAGDEGKILTAVLVQPVEDGEEVLETAYVEVEDCDRYFGSTILSWVTRDVPRYSRTNTEGKILLKNNAAQSVVAVEISFSADVSRAVLKAGDSKETVSGKAGETVVVVLDSEMRLEELTLETAEPEAISSIKAY